MTARGTETARISGLWTLERLRPGGMLKVPAGRAEELDRAGAVGTLSPAGRARREG
jgi:hypothetical protein